MGICLHCKRQLSGVQLVYCSNRCQSDKRYTDYIQEWLAGRKNGTRGERTKNFSAHIVRYLRSKYQNACAICSWSVMNVSLGSVPLEIDHIDGNSENNVESNLILLCPNCHSLTHTYKNANHGNGRLWRREKYVKIV